MQTIIRLVPWAGAAFISAIFIDSLRFKFTGHPTPRHIFETLKEWSGIDLFYPAGPWIIGLGELLSSVLLLALPLFLIAAKKRPLADLSQLGGALVALAIMSGAIVFHLFTPLGTATPTEWVNGEPVKFSEALFYAACVSWVLAVVIVFLRRDSLKAIRA
ncbi:MAG: hypothetical protein U5J99_00210 [Parvularculaceae bacterium]|nr:hypothetical protein [Parvularculaceae bacterium]